MASDSPLADPRIRLPALKAAPAFSFSSYASGAPRNDGSRRGSRAQRLALEKPYQLE